MLRHEVAATTRVGSGSHLLRGYDGDGARPLVRPMARATDDRLDPHEGMVWFEHDVVARFVLDPHGHILRSNARARAMIASGVVGAGGVLICPTHRSRPDLDRLLTRLVNGQQRFGRILFRAGDDGWRLLDLHALPGAEDKVFATASQGKPLSADHIEPLRTVFGLTRAEASVLTHLTCGDAPKDIGRKMHMSIHTVRAHLRAICMRMGVKGINGAIRLSFQLTT